MANHFSALKRARQTTKRTARNRANTSQLRTALRTLRESLEKGDKAAAGQTYRETVSALDKAIQKGVLHENTASRYKSRLSSLALKSAPWNSGALNAEAMKAQLTSGGAESAGPQIVLDLPLRFVILRRSRTSKQFLPVLTNLRPRCGNSLRIEQLSGMGGASIWVILANPFELGPNCSLASYRSRPSSRWAEDGIAA